MELKRNRGDLIKILRAMSAKIGPEIGSLEPFKVYSFHLNGPQNKRTKV
jgi:hypothetical protein